MSLENPFGKPILPPEETNPDSNIELIGALLGADSAEAYRKTIAGEIAKPVAQKPEFNFDTFDEQAFEQHNPVEQGEAETLFGENFLGSKDIENTFGFTIETKDIPPIPFTRQELKEAEEKGLTLMLNWDTLPDGTNLSGKKMEDILKGKQKDENPFIGYHFDKNDPTYTEETPRRGWALISNVAEYKSQNYLTQTDSLIADCPDTEVYRRAIKEYEIQKPHIEKLWQDYNNNWKEIAEILSNFTITTLTRDSLPERFQYMALSNRKTGIRIHENEYYWTSSRSSHGGLVSVGNFLADGTSVDGGDPKHRNSLLGVSFSRRY